MKRRKGKVCEKTIVLSLGRLKRHMLTVDWILMKLMPSAVVEFALGGQYINISDRVF